ncbi:site-specific DNA-methyltransferase [Desulforhopalus vacuolatus]|uniref:site-specific DNA-methyltransferase n=1 Tax=Desulforhopalus vacuolatus TaxID=40414 RepID=UPI0034DE5F80
MKKLKMHSKNFVNENIAKVAELFPNCVTEVANEDSSLSLHNSSLSYAIDFDQLRQELSSHIVEGPQERYHLNWPGKKEALLTANAPIAKTLRPCREESVDFDSTENLFIEGDNLDALKLLQENYLGKVKMIYIDPPYNTGNDFIYADDFAESTGDYLLGSGQKDEEGNRLIANTDSNGRFHSDWLSMMYSRLKLARNLLKDDGVIFISIDDGEQSNLKRMCDEIFGEDNFVATVVWQKRTGPDSRANLRPAHDYVLVFSKEIDNAKGTLNKLPLREKRKNDYKNKDNDPRGPWSSENLTGQTGHATSSQFYKITTPSGKLYAPPEGRCWALAEKTFLELEKDGRIWFGENGSNRPRLKKFLSDSDGMMAWTWWPNDEVGHNQEGTKEAKELLGAGDTFDNPKPTRLIKRALMLATKNDDLILDFFAGSATTAHAVMQLNGEDGGNRKFIMVQLPEECKEKTEAFKAGYKTIAEISKERIRRAGKKIKSESPITTQDLDIGFRVLKVDSSNMADIYYTPDSIKQKQLSLLTDNIKADRSPEDLLFQILLDWGVDLTLPISREIIKVQKAESERIKDEGNSDTPNSSFIPHPSSFQEFEVFFIDNNALAACFEKNGKISENFCKELAKRQPLRVVFRDSGFKDDSAKINVEQIFKLISPHTEVKCI